MNSPVNPNPAEPKPSDQAPPTPTPASKNSHSTQPSLSPEEETLEQQKAALKAKLSRGEIDGVTYNRLYMELVPKSESLGDHIRTLSNRNTNSSRLVLVLKILAAIPLIPVALIFIWRFYFSNSLTLEVLPDFSDVPISTIDSDPIQINLDPPLGEVGTYRGEKIAVRYRAYYDITATVVSKKSYFYFYKLHESGLFDTVAPLDFCLAWGENQNILKNSNWRFRNDYIWSPSARYSYNYARRCTWNYVGDPDSYSPLNESKISNNHLIPATIKVRDTLTSIHKGDRVRLAGYLVDVIGPSGVSLETSLTRDDVSKGGFNPVGTCETLYVTAVEKL